MMSLVKQWHPSNYHSHQDIHPAKYPTNKKRSLLKVTESSFDLLTPQSDNNSFKEMHPLDSRDVNICYSGTTELRTIKPTRSNSGNNFLLPSIVMDEFEKSSEKRNNINSDSSTIHRG